VQRDRECCRKKIHPRRCPTPSISKIVREFLAKDSLRMSKCTRQRVSYSWARWETTGTWWKLWCACVPRTVRQHDCPQVVETLHVWVLCTGMAWLGRDEVPHRCRESVPVKEGAEQSIHPLSVDEEGNFIVRCSATAERESARRDGGEGLLLVLLGSLLLLVRPFCNLQSATEAVTATNSK
jgi:hypothetical protein